MKADLRLDLKRTALLVVDLQEDQRSDPLCVADNLDQVLANAAQLLEAARAHGVAVFHAAFVRDFDTRPPRPFEPRADDGGPAFSAKGSPLVAICPEVAPLADEVVIHKNDASAFEEGSLDGRLKALDVEWLVIAGVWTEACIAASVRDAMAAGFRVLLVKDACTSGTPAMHQTGMLNIANRLYGGAIGDTGRAVALLRGAPANVWRNTFPVPFRFRLTNVETMYDSL
ncbi:isochorismatase family protein [Labrys wisconsinensis]|uniref:Nicotinamidase-related amidase n=1 Tax=Labrys wisconsinensis TaxID=425677 RepID=A0ABU0J9A4_9HYPH|nr:isochorismatase family protein [Labrys wisconsinensis]MDQ0470855.1 nicotinamidase-related amidase [Labrys wisconsinensis]